MNFQFQLDKSKTAQAIYEFLLANPGGKSVQDICVGAKHFQPETVKTFLGHLVVNGYVVVLYPADRSPIFGIPGASENLPHTINMVTGVQVPYSNSGTAAAF